MTETIILFKQMIIMFFIALIGLIAYKKNIIDDASCKRISSLIVNVANPALIISSVINSSGHVEVKNMYLAFLCGLILYAVLVAVSGIWPRLLRVEKSKYGTYKVMMIFSNIGFMGFPIMEAVYGSDSLLLGTTMLLPFNVLIYTYGVWCLKKDCEEQKSKKRSKKDIIKQVFNNGVIACMIAFCLFFCDIHLPDVVNQTVEKISAITAPLSMIVIGASFASLNLKELILDVRLWIMSALKLLIIPFVGTITFTFLLKTCGFDVNDIIIKCLINVVMLILATPIGSMTVMLAQEYGGDVKLTTKGVAFSTLLSVITIPFVSGIVGMIVG